MRCLDFRPRFTATVWAATYGPRDEIAGYWLAETYHAETRAWLDVLLRRSGIDDACESFELDVRITDNRPERDPMRWGPRLPFYWTTDANNERGDDLPF